NEQTSDHLAVCFADKETWKRLEEEIAGKTGIKNSDQQKHTRESTKNVPNKRNNKYRCEEEIRTSRP
ncbi:39929_t:CDS:2, partial [Gigaspora margarita]